MDYYQFWPLFSAALLIGFFVLIIASNFKLGANAWLVPAILCIVFLVFSLFTIAQEGPLGFWPNHSETFWGNQVWIDLLLAIGIAIYFIAEQAKSLGLRVAPWLLLVLCTGSIGVLAFFARVLYVRERA